MSPNKFVVPRCTDQDVPQHQKDEVVEEASDKLTNA
jgi:hypothetical protein